MRYCIKCGEKIDESNPKEKWAMIITKLGLKIKAFECFHFKCWKQFWDEAVEMKIGK